MNNFSWNDRWTFADIASESSGDGVSAARLLKFNIVSASRGGFEMCWYWCSLSPPQPCRRTGDRTCHHLEFLKLTEAQLAGYASEIKV